MKITLEAAALGVSCLDDPHPRYAKVVDLRENRRLQAFVLEREPNRGAKLTLEFADCGGVVDESNSPAVTHERCNGAPGPFDGHLDAAAASIDIPS
jgi:hypothetical protein